MNHGLETESDQSDSGGAGPEQETIWKRPQERLLHKLFLYYLTVQVPVNGTGP